MHASARLAEYLANSHLRMTRARRVILEQVMSSRGHFDADHLLMLIRGTDRNVSRATLYRTLALLVESGLVQRVEMDQGQARYEAMVGRHHHDHMVCLSCGRIVEFESPDIERIQEEVCKKKKFTMTEHTHQIRGYCARCTPAAARNARRAGTGSVRSGARLSASGLRPGR